MSEVSILYGPVASGLLFSFPSGHHLIEGVSVVACKLWYLLGHCGSDLVLAAWLCWCGSGDLSFVL